MSDEHELLTGRILVADNDPAFIAAFRQMLEMRGYKTKPAGSAREVEDAVAAGGYDLLTLDLDWGTGNPNGIDILRKVHELDPFLPVVMVTEHASIPTAVEATRLGATDYIEKMLNREKTLLTIKNAVEAGRLQRENRSFLSEIRQKYEIIGVSRAMREVNSRIEKVAPTDGAVLITGESGTGKGLVARQIHYNSRRLQSKFVAVDSGTLADTLAESELFGHRKGAFTGAVQDRCGMFEEAEGGTLFLDEVSNASAALQAKLLHVLQEREFRRVGENDMRHCDVRVIAATNRDLPAMIKESAFREDLYYRLRVVEIPVPPLRERREDIPPLANHFMEAKSRRHSGRVRRLSPEAVALMVDFDWPGNVRELENTIERIVILSSEDEISADEVQSILGNLWIEKVSPLRSLSEMTREFKRDCIIKAINLAEGRISRAAEILQIDRTHLYKLINEYELKDIK
jgi:two-component system nitrogen regulation response regulator NtrX